MLNDTIAAIATPFGTGALAIVRVTGDQAIEIVNQIWLGPNLLTAKANTLHYGKIIIDGNIVDEVMVGIYLAPKSFTGENLVEITTHGGILVTQKVLETLLFAGARLANPGEFTQRAFLNQKIDFIQAEAIMDIINASNETALKIAHQSLNKQTSNLISDLRDSILAIIATIEVNVDYPEYDDTEELTKNVVVTKLELMLAEIKRILTNSQKASLVKQGIKTAIIGKPNVGKSSLLNALVGEDRAIVSAIPGTTRDTIDVLINLRGLTLNLIDTAGIRQTVEAIEVIGIERSKAAIKQADLILLVFDSSQALDEYDQELLDLTKHKTRILIGNKSDLSVHSDFQKMQLISALTGSGISNLEGHIEELLKLEDVGNYDFNYLSNTRHINKLKKCQKAINEALRLAKENTEVDIINIELKEAYNELGDILGANNYTDLLDELFSKFCLGK